MTSKRNEHKPKSPLKRTVIRKFQLTQTTVECLYDPKYLLSRISPKYDEEAILIAVERWSIYLGESNNPIFQFKVIDKRISTKGNILEYVPINDGFFAVKYCSNKGWYNTDKNWFPELINMYSNDKIAKIAQKEGYDLDKNNMQIKTVKSFLKDRRNIPNFYFEVVPNCKEEVTYINRTPLSEINKNMLICVGSVSKEELFYFTVEEFTSYFVNVKLLADPSSGDTFDRHALNKLKNFCNSNLNDRDNRHIFTDLLSVISEIESCSHLIDLNLKQMIHEFKDKDEKIKDDIHSIFRKMIEMSLTMRGLKLSNNDILPLSSLNSRTEHEKYCLVFQQSYDIYKEYKEILSSSGPDVNDFISKINIITFSDSGLRFKFINLTLKAPNINHSRTIEDCIHQSFFGNLNDENACLRNNSNWILYTASWYLYMLGFDLNFKLEEIEEIS